MKYFTKIVDSMIKFMIPIVIRANVPKVSPFFEKVNSKDLGPQCCPILISYVLRLTLARLAY
jgi:hypothetical protein